jgi:hypothetical protein
VTTDTTATFPAVASNSRRVIPEFVGVYFTGELYGTPFNLRRPDLQVRQTRRV